MSFVSDSREDEVSQSQMKIVLVLLKKLAHTAITVASRNLKTRP